MAIRPLVEELESRVLLSGTTSVVPVLYDSAVKLDHAHIAVDLAKFNLNADVFGATLLADVTAIKKNDLTQATTVTPLVAKVKTDLSTLHSTLAAERSSYGPTVLADEAAVTADIKQIKTDKGNATAITADKAKLLTDRISLQGQLIADLNTRITTRQNSYTGIVTDGDAVVAAAQTDPNASAKLTKALTQWTTTLSTGEAKLTADLQNLVTDRTQLTADLTALQSQ